jgi:acetyl esterase/lipase
VNVWIGMGNSAILASVVENNRMAHVKVGRRPMLGMAMLAAADRVKAQPAPETIDIWPAAPSGGPGPSGPETVSAKGSLTNVSRPRLNAWRPAQPNGTAVVVIAGGGYAHIEAGHESTPACEWLQSLGVTAFELIYRLPQDGWKPLAPFQDGQRAMRVVRARAAAFAIDPARIGVIGFSAGGHLAGMTAVRPEAQLYQREDVSDDVPARPDFAALIYPVLTMMPPFDQTHAKREILGPTPSAAESEAWSVERHVDGHAPPMFLAQAADDPISPVDNSLIMINALRAARVRGELHMFQSGGHGWGMGRPGTAEQAWPNLFAVWARANGFLPTQA